MIMDLRTLEDNTHFYVINGNYDACIKTIDGKKYMHIISTGVDFRLTGNELLDVRIKKKKMKYLIEYYPAKPNEWFYVINMEDINGFTNKASIYENYKRGLEKYNKTESEILGWNNSWWQTTEANSVFEAIDIFRKNLKEYHEGDNK